MIDRQLLVNDLRSLVTLIEADLFERSESSEVPEMATVLRSEHQRAKQAERTAQSFEQWLGDYVTQVAAAWVLSCVFVRFLEDNKLIEPAKLAGPNERLRQARDEHELYFREHPTQTDREYLLAVFDQLADLPGVKDVFGKHNLIRQQPRWLSGDEATALLTFFQKIDANTGLLVHDFTDPNWDTRFLGDLYQDLSEAARKKYALLQTPEFVEEFILDRTLDPALDEFGLGSFQSSVISYQSSVISRQSEGRSDQSSVISGQSEKTKTDNRQLTTDHFKIIDPACGSGHFLLGAFPRILNRWQKQEPGTNVRELVQRTLHSIHGVDINPYAVAIARFRLLLAALKACGIERLKDAPGFSMNLACGDSLYHGVETQQTLGDWTDESHYFGSEDADELARILIEGSFHCVVANPPYITVRDKAANQAYRRLYYSCHRAYSLAVPFMQRILHLAVKGDVGAAAGYTGVGPAVPAA